MHIFYPQHWRFQLGTRVSSWRAHNKAFIIEWNECISLDDEQKSVLTSGTAKLFSFLFCKPDRDQRGYNLPLSAWKLQVIKLIRHYQSRTNPTHNHSTNFAKRAATKEGTVYEKLSQTRILNHFRLSSFNRHCSVGLRFRALNDFLM
jgi:hypothetical protein